MPQSWQKSRRFKLFLSAEAGKHRKKNYYFQEGLPGWRGKTLNCEQKQVN
jgi:hypothetical protein